MRGEARVRRRGASDLGNVDGPARQCCYRESLSKGSMAREAQEVWRGIRHL